MSEPEFFLGQRVMVADEVFGTICYVGNIPNSSGIWLGIDWDDPGRGRHNGTFDGHRYFQASHEKSGSFVRPPKVSAGLSYSETIDARYCQTIQQLEELRKCGLIISSNALDKSNLPEMVQNNSSQMQSSSLSMPNEGNAESESAAKSKLYMPHAHVESIMISGMEPDKKTFQPAVTSGFHGVQIELVGITDTLGHTNISQLKQVLVQGMPLSHCSWDDAEKMRDRLLCARELNMAHTLVSDWCTVARLCHSIRFLDTLCVSDNRIRLPQVLPSNSDETDSSTSSPQPPLLNLLKYYPIVAKEMERFPSYFKAVKQFIAVRMEYNWEEMSAILPWFSQLEKLVIAHNKITVLHRIDQLLPDTLSCLDISGNVFDSPESTQSAINALSCLKQVKILLLGDCMLHDFVIPSNTFGSLEQLSISHNKIQDWATISQLDALPELVELILLENPIVTSCQNWETARQWTIARLAKLQLLNRNEITKEERRGAEIDYLRVHGQLWWDVKLAQQENQPQWEEKRAEFNRLHPSYARLVGLHGAVELGELKKFTCALKEGLLELRIICPNLPAQKEIVKKIPPRMTVQHLLSLLRRLLRLKANQLIRVCYINEKMPNVEFELDTETREIGFYNVSSGDILSVHLL